MFQVSLLLSYNQITILKQPDYYFETTRLLFWNNQITILKQSDYNISD